jgi:hypothetical protein
MTFQEACESCISGNFLSNVSFDSKQSMHSYRDILYYEDGACLLHHLDFISSQNWAKDGWYIKYTQDKVDKEKLDTMHKVNTGFMLSSDSYEDCIK